MRVELTDHTVETEQAKITRLLQEYKGTTTKCPTAYNKEDKGAGYKDKTGDSVSTAMTPITIYTDETGKVCSEDEGVPSSVVWRALSWEHTIILHEKILYNKLMKLDPKYIRVLSKVKKHIKRKARASANKDHKSKQGKTIQATHRKRPKVILPSSL